MLRKYIASRNTKQNSIYTTYNKYQILKYNCREHPSKRSLTVALQKTRDLMVSESKSWMKMERYKKDNSKTDSPMGIKERVRVMATQSVNSKMAKWYRQNTTPNKLSL